MTNREQKQLEQLMIAELEAIITYPYEDKDRKVDIENLIRSLRQYGHLRNKIKILESKE